MKRITISILLLVIALLGVILAMLNADSVAIDFYFTSVELPLALLLYLALALGALGGIVLSSLMI
ncbi:MAG: lipopolysaccharide assembly protein LapA domain-containing protein, partial [Pseudomonadota bacterium]